MKTSNRKAVYDDLKKYCCFAEDDAYIEVTEWTNGEGFDIDINDKKRISLTSGELNAIEYLVKSLDYATDIK